MHIKLKQTIKVYDLTMSDAELDLIAKCLYECCVKNESAQKYVIGNHTYLKNLGNELITKIQKNL